MKFDSKYCSEFSKNFCKSFLSNDVRDFRETEKMYMLHFVNSKTYGNEWINNTTDNIRSTLNNKKINSNIISALVSVMEFKVFLNESILFNIKSIINNKQNLKFKKDFNRSNHSYSSEGFKHSSFFLFANNFLLNKMYLVINNYNKIFKNNNVFSFDIIFDKINSSSLNGKLFSKTDTFIFFKLPISKYSEFYFYTEAQLFVINESQDLKNDKQNTFLNFIHSNLIYSNNYNDTLINYNTSEKFGIEKIINEISNDTEIDYHSMKNLINKNVNFIFDFDYTTGSHNFNNYDLFTIYLLAITNESLLGKNININLRFEFIKEIAYQHEIDNVINNEYIENTILSTFSTLKDYNTFIDNMSLVNNNEILIKDILIKNLNIINQIIRVKDSNNISIKNALYSSGLFNKQNRDFCYEILSNFNMKNNKDFIKIFYKDYEWISSLLNSIHFENIYNQISNWISNNINEEIIIKKITEKHPVYTHREIKKIILKIKNKPKN